MGEPIPVSIVYASPLMRDALKHELTGLPEIRPVRAFGSAQEVLERPVAERHILLYDWSTAKRDGMPRLKEVLHGFPQAKIVVFNVTDVDQAMIQCAQAGVTGCIFEGASRDEIVDGIRSVYRGTPAVSPRCITSLLGYVAKPYIGSEKPPLTKREEEILRLVAEGLSNKEIGQRLFLQPQTVKNYVHTILGKLNFHKRTDIMRLFR